MNELKTKLIESMEKIRWDDSQSECANYMEIIKNTSNSLEEALDIINDYDDALNLISDEYKLLVDTIVKENMGMTW